MTFGQENERPEMERWGIQPETMGSRSSGCVPHFLVALVSQPATGTPKSSDTTLPFHFWHFGQKWKGRVSSQTNSLENDGF